MSKPTWDEAPDGFDWLAMDDDGRWVWFRKAPRLDDGGWMPIDGVWKTHRTKRSDPGAPYLEPRP